MGPYRSTIRHTERSLLKATTERESERVHSSKIVGRVNLGTYGNTVAHVERSLGLCVLIVYIQIKKGRYEEKEISHAVRSAIGSASREEEDIIPTGRKQNIPDRQLPPQQPTCDNLGRHGCCKGKLANQTRQSPCLAT